MTKEKCKMGLTEKQIDQIDHVNAIAYVAMCDLLGKDLEWDMEWVGEVSDALVEIAIEYFNAKEEELYPYEELEEE
jgi:hypothetical protein